MPKEHADTSIIERAVRFHATIFLGAGRYHTETFDTLAAARERADGLGAEIRNGRRGIVYAENPEGRATLVPKSYEPSKGATTMDIAMTAVEIAKLTAALKGETGFKRANSKDAAAKRFITLAHDAGVAEPMAILTAPSFSEAKAMVEAARNAGNANAKVANGSESPADAEQAAPKEKAPKAAKAAKPAPTKARTGQRAAVLEAAQRGEVPAAPDFSAETHKRFRGKLAELVALVEKGDVAGLKAYKINPVSSSPKALDRYRNLAVIALEARAAAATTGEEAA